MLNEVHCAHRIFFIGYSAKDLEIAQALLSVSEEIRYKSVMICGPNEGLVSKRRLEKFGAVFPIGLDGFSKILPDKYESKETLQEVIFVNRMRATSASQTIDSGDIDRLILGGEFDYAKYANQKAADKNQRLYCVPRERHINTILGETSSEVRRFLVSADIGNGKSIFLDQLTHAALARGYKVFRVDSRLTEVFQELEKLLSSNTRQLFVVDDLVRNKRAAEFIGHRLSGLSLLVCSSREELDSVGFESLSNTLGGVTREIGINTLDDTELAAWDELLEGWGYWEQKISLSQYQRIRFLREDCGAENRAIVLSIFKSSSVATKIDSIVNYFLGTNPQHIRAFIAMLISSLCQKHVAWDNIIQWLGIREDVLKRDLEKQDVFNFTSNKRYWHQFTSAQLAGYIFKTFDFDAKIVVDVYTQIVRETAYSANDPRSGFEFRENMKELLKYRFLTRLFGDNSKALASIESVYLKLGGVPRIRKNDQFWLQWAMSKMADNNLIDAEQYINTALGIAEKHGADYSPHQILDQRVRLFLLKNSKKNGAPKSVEIDLAMSDLSDLLATRGSDIIYPIRSAPYIENLVEAKIDDMDMAVREKVLSVLQQMTDLIGNSNRLAKSQKGETGYLKGAIRNATLVLKNA